MKINLPKTEKGRNRLVFGILLLIVEIIWAIGGLKNFLIFNAIGLIVWFLFWCAIKVGIWIAKGE